MVFMARSAWDVSYQQERNPELTFSATKERSAGWQPKAQGCWSRHCGLPDPAQPKSFASGVGKVWPCLPKI
jgi:hypothetical protein